MLLAHFQTIVENAAGFSGLDRQNLDAEEFADLRNYANNRLRYAWGFRAWDDLERTEERIFCDKEWNTTATYTKGAVVFYRPTGLYYVAIRGITANQVPEDNLSRWAELAESYDGVADYNAATAYTPGDRATDPVTGTVYQSTSTQTGIDLSDAAGWGALPLFDRYVAYEQTGKTAFTDVLRVTDLDPKRFANARDIEFNTSENGLQIWEDVPFVWLTYRLRAPYLTGVAFDATATYAAGEQMYFLSATTKGNFYNCVTATLAAEDPENTAAKWAIVEIPRLFQGFLENGMAADYSVDSRPAKAAKLESMAGEFLTTEALKHDNQNERRLDVRTR